MRGHFGSCMDDGLLDTLHVLFNSRHPPLAASLSKCRDITSEWPGPENSCRLAGGAGPNFEAMESNL